MGFASTMRIVGLDISDRPAHALRSRKNVALFRTSENQNRARDVSVSSNSSCCAGIYGVEPKHRFFTEPDVRTFSFNRESRDSGVHPLQHVENSPANKYALRFGVRFACHLKLPFLNHDSPQHLNLPGSEVKNPSKFDSNVTRRPTVNYL